VLSIASVIPLFGHPKTHRYIERLVPDDTVRELMPENSEFFHANIISSELLGRAYTNAICDEYFYKEFAIIYTQLIVFCVIIYFHV